MSRHAPFEISCSPHINNQNGVVTGVGITSDDSWTRDKSGSQTWIQTANPVKLLDNLQEPVLLLTPELERFAKGADL